MESFLKKYAIDEQCEGLEVYYERAKREYSVHGNEIMDFEKYQVFTYMEEDIRRVRDELVKDSDNVLYAYFLNEAIRAKDDLAVKALSTPKLKKKTKYLIRCPSFLCFMRSRPWRMSIGFVSCRRRSPRQRRRCSRIR